ncbi:MAG: U32 family peptidase C-terminal domain-containing protein [Chloroflexota bacterium]
MEQRIGYVTHYYTRLGVAVLALRDALQVGDAVHILGHTTNFTQQVESLEIEHQPVQSVRPGAEVALKVVDKVRQGDRVYKISEA